MVLVVTGFLLPKLRLVHCHAHCFIGRIVLLCDKIFVVAAVHYQKEQCDRIGWVQCSFIAIYSLLLDFTPAV